MAMFEMETGMRVCMHVCMCGVAGSMEEKKTKKKSSVLEFLKDVHASKPLFPFFPPLSSALRVISLISFTVTEGLYF